MQVNIQNMSNTNLNKEYVSPIIQVTYLNTKCCLLQQWSAKSSTNNQNSIEGTRASNFGAIKNWDDPDPEPEP